MEKHISQNSPVATFSKGVHPIGYEEAVVELALAWPPQHVVNLEPRGSGPHQMVCRTPQLLSGGRRGNLGQ